MTTQLIDTEKLESLKIDIKRYNALVYNFNDGQIEAYIVKEKDGNISAKNLKTKELTNLGDENEISKKFNQTVGIISLIDHPDSLGNKLAKVLGDNVLISQRLENLSNSENGIDNALIRMLVEKDNKLKASKLSKK